MKRLFPLFCMALAGAGCDDGPASLESRAAAQSLQAADRVRAELETTAEQRGLVGAWERYIPTAEAPIAYHVLELFDNGWMILHDAQGGRNAVYTRTGDTLTLQGDLAELWPGSIAYRVAGATLTLDRARALGGNEHTEWTRIERAPFFESVLADGDTMPTGLPKLAAEVTTAVGRDWRSDAIPVSLDAQRLRSGDYALIFAFYSPADGSGLRSIIGRWGFVTAETPNVRWGKHAVPGEFVDLPELIAHAHASGNNGPLVKAELRSWSTGAIWTLSTLAADARTTVKGYYSAESGQRVAEDTGPMSDYIEDYNAQWDAIAAAFRRNNAARTSAYSEDNGAWGFAPSGSDAGGSAIGGDSCAYASHAACNAAAAGDLWGAERIENGRSSASEQAWYD